MKQSESDKNSLALKTNESASKKNKITESPSPKQFNGLVEKPWSFPSEKKPIKLENSQIRMNSIQKAKGQLHFKLLKR